MGNPLPGNEIVSAFPPTGVSGEPNEFELICCLIIQDRGTLPTRHSEPRFHFRDDCEAPNVGHRRALNNGLLLKTFDFRSILLAFSHFRPLVRLFMLQSSRGLPGCTARTGPRADRGPWLRAQNARSLEVAASKSRSELRQIRDRCFDDRHSWSICIPRNAESLRSRSLRESGCGFFRFEPGPRWCGIASNALRRKGAKRVALEPGCGGFCLLSSCRIQRCLHRLSARQTLKCPPMSSISQHHARLVT